MEKTPEGMASIPPVGTGPGMSAETASAVRGIVLAGGHCHSQCWSARGSACRCSCGGENHGAMGTGGRLPTALTGGKGVQTLLWPPPEGDEPTPAVRRVRSRKTRTQPETICVKIETETEIREDEKNMGHESENLEKFLMEENCNFNKIQKIEYLASPYSHPHSAVRKARVRAAEAAATEMMGRNMVVFSPIVYSATIQERDNFRPPKGWYMFDLHFLAAAGGLTVLEVPGWKMSRGILIEIGFARARKLPVSRMEWPEIRKLLQLEQGTVETLEHWQEGFRADGERETPSMPGALEMDDLR